MHEGHRKRMMERLLSGSDNLQDHEILEMLLFNALPRINTNPIAHNLLKAFGSLSGVFLARVEQLTEVDGIGPSTAEYLRVVGLCLERVKPNTEDLPEYFNLRTYSEFLEKSFRGVTREFVEIFCLKKNGQVQFRKTFTVGSRHTVVVEPEEVSKLVVLQKPHAIVIAHNHPNTVSDPSENDNKFTAQLQVICSANNVELYDHIIVGTDGVYSYFLSGQLESIKKHYHVANIANGRL